MSTVPEIIASNHAGIKSAAISCITNMAAGILNQPLTHEEVLKTGNAVKESIKNIIDSFIKSV